MVDITSANAIVTLTVPLVFSTPQQLQGFAADDIFDVPDIEEAEAVMGVDGLLSAGKVFVPTVQTFALQADSPSFPIFDAWHAYQTVTKSVAVASGVIKLPAIGVKFNIAKGFLIRYKPIADARRILQPRRFTIAWEAPVLAPIAGA